MISVVVTSYGKDKETVDKCLSSISAQSPTTEVIVVNDHAHVCANRNKGAEKATGEYIIFVDADKFLAPTMFEEMKEILDTDPFIGWVYCNYKREGVLADNWRCKDFRGQRFSLEVLCKLNYIDTCSLVRRAIIPKWDETINRCNDWDFWLTLALDGHVGYWIDKPLFTAWYADGDISVKGWDDYEKWYKIVVNKHLKRMQDAENSNTLPG